MRRSADLNSTLLWASAKEGHPTVFLKVLHFALFGASHSVRDHLFANGVSKDVVYLNDIKFFKSVLFTLVSRLSPNRVAPAR